ncbi:putative ring finger [Lyophyllum shimeji]|uniref:RING-type E3 ubiquitin transferase n=1 Tax=Lyophyllum shimeji TaxID=47721 RepID=A0A9P3PXP9_LYOSH|nr:putative ring finger [Lyophyllum shimeji]
MDPLRDEEAGLPAARGGTARPRSSIPSFLFISFMLFMLTSHNGDEFLARHHYQDALRSLEYQLGNYSAWRNGTSEEFSVPDRDAALGVLAEDFGIQGKVLDPHQASYYSNVTGFIHGSSHFYNITPSTLVDNATAPWNSHARAYMAAANETEIVERIGTWNWTASDKVQLSVVEKLPTHANGTMISDTIALVHGRIELTDANSNEDLRLEFEGLHFIRNGSLYGLAEPAGRHIDIRLFPSLVPVSAKNETAALIEPELTARINKLKNLIDDGVVDQDSNNDDAPKSDCGFTFHAQLHPVNVPEHLMRELEDEIQKPTGASTVVPPKLSVTGLLISKECGIMFEIGDTEGLRSRTFFRKVTTYAGSAGLVYLTLLWLFARQSERSRTPSGLGRVSRWMFLSQATIDSVSFAGHITFAILAEGRPSLSLVAPAFLACILFVYEAQFSVLIHQIQIPEDAVPSRPPPPDPAVASPSPTPTPATTTPSIPASGSENTYPPPPASNPAPPPSQTPPPAQSAAPSPSPSPSPSPTPATPPEQLSFFAFFIHHIRTDPQARLWVTLFIFLTFIVRVILSPTLSMVFVSVTYSLIWLPQIIRAARRGRSSGLTTEYVVGTTSCRLYLALYFLACPKNVLDVTPRRWSYLLAAFVCFQALVLILQELLGPAFFLPKRYVTAKPYDYHPPIPLPDPEAPEPSLGDCAICMDAIVVDHRARASEKSASALWDGTGSERRGKGGGGLLSVMEGAGARKVYSLAPCHHLFHTECLEKWLAIKNICPQCRRPLPPL